MKFTIQESNGGWNLLNNGVFVMEYSPIVEESLREFVGLLNYSEGV